MVIVRTILQPVEKLSNGKMIPESFQLPIFQRQQRGSYWNFNSGELRHNFNERSLDDSNQPPGIRRLIKVEL